MERRNLFAAPAVAATLAVSAIGTAAAQSPADVRSALVSAGLVEDVKKRGSLRIGMSTFVPWAMRNKQGQLMGFEVDIATRLAEEMSVKPDLVPTAWDGIIPALLSGRFDVIIGGMSVTVPRNLTVNFSEPYQTTGISLVANKRLAAGFTTLAQFNRPDVTIAARRGTPSVNSVVRFMPRATLRQFDEEATALQEVVNGRAHAMVGSIPLPAHSAKRYPNELFVPIAEPFERAHSAFAVRKGDPDALNLFDNWIRLHRDVDDFIEQRRAYWFDGLDWEDQIQR